MSWLVILVLAFIGLHFGVMLPPQAAILGGVIVTVALWIFWKLKWVILGIIGLEELFGGNRDGGAS